MKKLIRLLAFVALVATLALPALAQNTPSTSTTAATPAAGQDDAEAKTALYKKFTDNRNTNPTVAYEAGKEYLQKYEAKDGPEDQYVKYIKKWVSAYDKVARKNQLNEEIKAKNYNAAFALGKQVVADFPEDLLVLYQLSGAGFSAATSGNEANNADASAYTKRTIQLIQSGKSFDPTKPLAAKEKDEMIGNLNYALGILLRKTAPGEAVTYFVNAAQLESPAKKDPLTYYTLAEIYETTEYSKLATQFNASCKTEEQLKTPECVELKAKADQVVDHLIDALARAIAYSDASPDKAKYAQARTTWMESITNYYKYRTGSDTGLKELIAGITSRPIPKPGEPVVPPLTPTTPATSTTPTQPSGTTNTQPAGTTTTPATTPATTPTPTPATKPGGNTSSTKPTPNR